MLKSLKFVKGAICSRDLVPVLTYFHIENGTVTGYNGTMALQAPINVDMTCTPLAKPLIKAIEGCEGTVTLTMSPAGKLVVSSGDYKVYVDCTTESFPQQAPDGEEILIDFPLLKYLKKLAPFISKDASRAWSQGIMFKGGSAFVTNNIILVEQWIGGNFPDDLIIPECAIRELLRIKEEPVTMRIAKNSCSFIYADGSFLKTQLVNAKFPPMEKIFDAIVPGEKVKQEFFEGLEKLLPFIDSSQSVYLTEDSMSTHRKEEEGCHIKLKGVDKAAVSRYNLKQLLLLKTVATSLNLTVYPSPAGFFGDKLRGVIVPLTILEE